MGTMPDEIDRHRRRFIGTAAIGVAATAGFVNLLPERLSAANASPAANQGDPPVATGSEAVRPFRVNVPEEQLADLRRRLAATRWPERETVNDDSQGVPLAMLQDLARYWAADYDWRKCEMGLIAFVWPRELAKSTSGCGSP